MCQNLDNHGLDSCSLALAQPLQPSRHAGIQIDSGRIAAPGSALDKTGDTKGHRPWCGTRSCCVRAPAQCNLFQQVRPRRVTCSLRRGRQCWVDQGQPLQRRKRPTVVPGSGPSRARRSTSCAPPNTGPGATVDTWELDHLTQFFATSTSLKEAWDTESSGQLQRCGHQRGTRAPASRPVRAPKRAIAGGARTKSYRARASIDVYMSIGARPNNGPRVAAG
jgi:hypothetical protein